MKRLSLALAALALSASHADATLIAADLFDDPSYSPGGNIYPNSDQDIGYGLGIGPNDGTGFTTGWQNPYYTATRTVAPALSYPGLATPGYGAAGPAYYACPQAYCVNSTAIRNLAANTAIGDLWVSFLIKDDDVTAQNLASLPQYAGFGIEDANNNFVYVGVPGLDTPTADYSLQTGTSQQNIGAAQSATAASPGQTVLLVADISSNGDAYLYVNPTIGAALGAPDATIAAPFAPSAVTYLHWSDSWGWTYGDLRIGTTLADVTPPPTGVPEPAAWALMLAGVASLGRSLRARRSRPRAAA